MRLPLAAVAACAFLAVSVAPAPAATNNISTGAGTGTAGYNGDGIPATTAQLANPIFVAATADGGYLIANQGICRVRKVAADGTIATVAGNGTCGFAGDTGPATAASLSAAVNDVEPMPDGGFLIADANNNRVRRVFADGTINTVAGTGTASYNGDGIAAATAHVNFPTGLAARTDGSFLISDNDNFRIRNVDAGGTITTIAGTGAAGSGGDGAAATSATINGPGDVEMMPDGGFLLADTDNNRVRRVSPGGTITAAAGTGTFGFMGDGADATLAQMRAPNGLAALPDGSYLIADRQNNRIRRVGTDGIINTVAGNGTAGSAGDGGPATAAELNNPFGVSVNAEGDYLIADTSNHRVRIVDAGDPPPPPPDPPPPDPPPDLAAARGEEDRECHAQVRRGDAGLPERAAEEARDGRADQAQLHGRRDQGRGHARNREREEQGPGRRLLRGGVQAQAGERDQDGEGEEDQAPDHGADAYGPRPDRLPEEPRGRSAPLPAAAAASGAVAAGATAPAAGAGRPPCAAPPG